MGFMHGDAQHSMAAFLIAGRTARSVVVALAPQTPAG